LAMSAPPRMRFLTVKQEDFLSKSIPS
jgi:hypothetical protein